MPPASSSPAETALGTVGGLLLSLCLLPQLAKMWRTRSAADLSHGWLALYGAGLAFNAAYLVLARAPVGAAFHGVELGLVGLMAGWKVVLDRRGKRREGEGEGEEGGGEGGGTAPKPAGVVEAHPPVPPTV